MDLPGAMPQFEGLPRYAAADQEDEEPERQPRRRRSDFVQSEMPAESESSQAGGPELEPFAVSESEPEIEWEPEPVSLEPEPEPVPLAPEPEPPPNRPPAAQTQAQPREQRPAAEAARPRPGPVAKPAPPAAKRHAPGRPAPKPLAPSAPAPQRPGSRPPGPAGHAPAPSAPAAPRQTPRQTSRPAAPRRAAPPLSPAPQAPVGWEEAPPPAVELVPTSEPEKSARTGEDVRQELRDYLDGVRDKLDKGAAGPSNPGDLLDYLGKLSDYLPERDKNRFRGSNERLAMESLKAQLAGKKGLRQKIAEQFQPVVPHRKEPMTRSLIVDTFSYLKDLSAWHPDKAVAAAMRERIESIVARMGSLK